MITLNQLDLKWYNIYIIYLSVLQYPQLFRGILSPWKGLLLYGPPGKDLILLLSNFFNFIFRYLENEVCFQTQRNVKIT